MIYILFIPLVLLVTCFQKKRPTDDKRPNDPQWMEVSNESQSGRGTVSATTRSSNVEVCNQPMVVNGLHAPSIPSSIPQSSTSDEKKEDKGNVTIIPKKDSDLVKKSVPSLKSTQQTHTSSSADLLIETMTKGQDSLFDKTISYDREGHVKRSQKYTRSYFKKKKKNKTAKTSTCGNTMTVLEKTQPNSDQLTPETTQEEALTTTTQKTTDV
ncbi:hypothetical protein PRIPAC_83762 [Pristionchus pacificus]|uniref:Uncharacterized protein n=1 Tax=Pristionchus pacificus TaxID=54126 RepID=A0A2A6BW61_PRIPA|nr:hypothetical protein PRIPAC_83762 [Pristionchus pacificus]|eukprot:PDM70108.1 hypothetical protein PRIPAC_43848 [Pristionchus pacificus]